MRQLGAATTALSLASVLFVACSHDGTRQAETDSAAVAIADTLFEEVGVLPGWPPYARLEGVDTSRLSAWQARIEGAHETNGTDPSTALASMIREALGQWRDFKACGSGWSASPGSRACYEAWLRYHVGHPVNADSLLASAAVYRRSSRTRNAHGAVARVVSVERTVQAADSVVRSSLAGLFPVEPQYSTLRVLEGDWGVALMYGGAPNGQPLVRVDSTLILALAPAEIVRLVAHEVWPGHHMTGSLDQSGVHPLFAGIDPTGYREGWATYAEMLVVGELGGSATALAAAHLADLAELTQSDVSLHLGEWSSEQAADSLIQAGFAPGSAAAVVEDLRLRPGRMAAYFAGYMAFRSMRRDWDAFLEAPDRGLSFHCAVLATGPMPLSVLKESLDRRVAAERCTM